MRCVRAQGTLRGFDQSKNVILHPCHERVFSLHAGIESVPLGLYIIRGDNVYEPAAGCIAPSQAPLPVPFSRVDAPIPNVVGETPHELRRDVVASDAHGCGVMFIVVCVVCVWCVCVVCVCGVCGDVQGGGGRD